MKNKIANLVAEASGLMADEITIENPRDTSHGDYATSIALKLANQLGKNPRDVAQDLANKLAVTTDFDLEIAGPGFINFKLKDKVLVELATTVANDISTLKPLTPANNKIICEYSAPNVAKPLGVHHLLSTVIGQSLANIYKYLGYDVVSINHIGDWGTQFGKLIYAIKTWGDRKKIEEEPIDQLLKLYVKFHDEAEKDDSIEDLGRLEFKKLEDGDPENRELWEWIVNESMLDVQKTYNKLGGIEFDHIMGESFYEDKTDSIVNKGVAEGVFIDGEGGALVANFANENMPTTVIRRSDGATVYITRDIATLKYRMDKWDPAKIIYVVDVAQKLHFEQIRDIGRRLNIIPPDEDIFQHVIFGRMRFADGKMSTRKGNILLLDDVLDEAVNRARTVVEEKNPNINDEEKDAIAKMAGVGGVKYAILAQSRHTDITFSWDKVINLEGNSAVYLQYTYARANKVLREAGTFQFNNFDQELSAHEKSVLRLLPRFIETVELAAQEYKPHYISEYLFSLAQAFNGFYANEPILKADEDKKLLRLQICKSVCQVIKDGLMLLSGIDAPEKM